jgi:hypothetical protein
MDFSRSRRVIRPGFQLLNFLLFRRQRFALRNNAFALLLNLVDPAA